MKKIILSSVLLSALVLGSVPAMAENTTSEGKATLSALTEGEAGSVTPEDPDPGHTGGTGQTGLLTIDAVPYFDFQGTGLKGTFNDVVPEGHTRNAQVTDRRGTGAGWELGLKIDAFKNAEGVALKGAKITLPVSIAAGKENESAVPSTISSVDGLIDPINGLDAGGIVTAATQEGYGTWLTKFVNSSLEVADGNAQGSYTSVFTWSLGATPVGEGE